MIEAWSDRIAAYLQKHDPDGDADPEVVSWQISIYMNYIATTILTIVFSLFTGHVFASIITMIVFVVIRRYSGGFHFPSLTACAIISAILFTIIPLINLSIQETILINFLALIVCLLRAPNFHEEIVYSAIHKYRKITTVAIVAINFLILSDIVALTFMLQALLLIPKGGQ